EAWSARRILRRPRGESYPRKPPSRSLRRVPQNSSPGSTYQVWAYPITPSLRIAEAIPLDHRTGWGQLLPAPKSKRNSRKKIAAGRKPYERHNYAWHLHKSNRSEHNGETGVLARPAGETPAAP